MKPCRSTCLLLLAITLPTGIWAADEEPLTTESPTTATTTSECGLYLAESSTTSEEDPKWGIYAGKDIPKYSPVGYGEVGIQTFHLKGNAWNETGDGHIATPRLDIVHWVESLVWVPHSSGGQFELSDSGKILMAVPGLGVLGGTNEKMINADWNHSFAYGRPAWGEEAGISHPGRGASSPYFELTVTAKEVIPAGMEVFLDYGDNYNDGEKTEEEEITPDDRTKIDETIDKMIEFFRKHEESLDPQSKQEIYQFLINDVLEAAVGAKKAELISNILPETPDKLKEAKENGGAIGLNFPFIKRSLPWLAEHGRCIDNLRPGPSTIPHAGRGAFATRSMKAGARVVPVPLLQIPDSEILKMYPLVEKRNEEDQRFFVRKAGSVPTGSQLLLNYCLGHPESKLVFFPSGPGFNFINHSPEPNAKLVWSDHPKNRVDWFNFKPKELLEDDITHLGLMMEVVATKDIPEGEEVTIDYGPEWAVAWKEHVAKWDTEIGTGPGTKWPMRALDYSDMYARQPFPLNSEGISPSVMTKCFLVTTLPNDSAAEENGDKIRIWADEPATMKSENLFDCQVSEVEETKTPEGTKSWSYTVRSGTTWVKQVPHKAIVFVDRPGTSDQHLVASFRHYIGIPDEIFPLGAWRNINEVESYDNDNSPADEDEEFEEEEDEED